MLIPRFHTGLIFVSYIDLGTGSFLLQAAIGGALGAAYFFKKGEREGYRRVLIYGAGNGGALALREIQANPALGMRAMGFLDDDPRKRLRAVNDCPVFGLESLDDMVRQRTFDELVISTPKIPDARTRMVAERCTLAGLPVRRFSIGWEEMRAVAVEAGAEAEAEDKQPA